MEDSEGDSFYAVLNVSRDASTEDVRRAYRNLAQVRKVSWYLSLIRACPVLFACCLVHDLLRTSHSNTRHRHFMQHHAPIPHTHAFPSSSCSVMQQCCKLLQLCCKGSNLIHQVLLAAAGAKGALGKCWLADSVAILESRR